MNSPYSGIHESGVVYPAMSSTDPLGSVVLLDNAEFGVVPSVALPDGFYFAEPDGIAVEELAGLNNSVGVFGYTTPADVEKLFEESHAYGEKVIGIGVRDTCDGELVGYGALSVEGCYGTLHDLMVSPYVHNRGIGRAVLRERLVQADRQGLLRVQTELRPSNILRKHYLANGFEQRRNSVYVRDLKIGAAVL